MEPVGVYGYAAIEQRLPFQSSALSLGWCGWRPRTDAAECDTQFYKLFVSVILPLEDISQRVIDTVLYRCQLFGLYFYI